MKIIKITIAVNRIGQENADFINCVVWNSQAENLCKYQEKGSQIGIVGNLKVEQYQDSNGDTRYKTYVLASNIEYLGSKKSKEETTNNNVATTKEKEDPFQDFGEEIQLSDDDLPF